RPKIAFVLSKNEPQEKASPGRQSKPSFRNFYTRLRRKDNDYRDDQQTSDCDAKQLGGFQDEAEEPRPRRVLTIIHSIKQYSGVDCLRKQALTFKTPGGDFE